VDDPGFEYQLWGPHPPCLVGTGVLFPGRETDLSPSSSVDGAVPLRPSCLYGVYRDGVITVIIIIIIIIIIISLFLSHLHSSAVFSHIPCTPDCMVVPRLGTIFFSSVCG